jgi:hypothetical protein
VRGKFLLQVSSSEFRVPYSLLSHLTAYVIIEFAMHFPDSMTAAQQHMF